MRMRKRRLLYILTGSIIICLLSIFLLVRLLYGIHTRDGRNNVVLFIPTGSSYHQVTDSIVKKVSIDNLKIFNWIAEKKRYPSHIRPGKYLITGGMSYIGIINLLRSGEQIPVKVTFNNIRRLDDLAGKIGGQIEADSGLIMTFLNDPENYRMDGFTRENVISLFIPNTYEFFWNTTPGGLYTRMLKEYNKFWNDKRMVKAETLGLTKNEVAILASIIDDEVVKPEEKPRIAGVYLNRLKKGIPLQACPTIKFALNDFTITRVLYKHLLVESPYNTYKHRGFPPGPIGCPTIEGLDAVLNAEKHEYYYFAAKADFSGYHNFSRTLAEHNRYAALYQKELDKRKIFK